MTTLILYRFVSIYGDAVVAFDEVGLKKRLVNAILTLETGDCSLQRNSKDFLLDASETSRFHAQRISKQLIENLGCETLNTMD
jgi:hypothetical protein